MLVFCNDTIANIEEKEKLQGSPRELPACNPVPPTIHCDWPLESDAISVCVCLCWFIQTSAEATEDYFCIACICIYPYMSHLILYSCEYLSSIRTHFLMCIFPREAHCPPWRKKKVSVWEPLEDCEPGELWGMASGVELLLALGAFSLQWCLWNGLVAAERRKAHHIFWTCSATLRPNSKRYSHKSHFFWLFQWTVSQIKMKLSPRLLDRSLF